MANSPPRNVEIKGQDHMLAYITPEEGDILQSLGGSGAPGPMGIPAYWTTSADSANAGAAASEAGMGQEGGDDAAAVADPVGIAHGQGITSKNPFGNRVPGFIKALSSIFGPLDYTNQYKDDPRGAQYAMNQIANLNVANTMNPNNVQGVIGFDPKQAPNQPRSGIQKGFGSLFGRPTGQMTTLGPIAAQRSVNPMDALGQSIFGMMAKGTLPGIMASIIGPPQTYAVKDSIGYNRDVDPAVSGNQSLGTMADIASFGLTGGSSAQAQDAYSAITGLAPDAFSNVVDSVKDALGFAQTGGKAGTANSVATDPNMNAKGIDFGIGSLDTPGSAWSNYKDTNINSGTIPSNISFADFMAATTPGTPQYTSTMNDKDLSSITYGN